MGNPVLHFIQKTCHLFCSEKQLTGFYMKCNTGLKFLYSFLSLLPQHLLYIFLKYSAYFQLCEFFKIDFLLWRLWVGLFVMVILFCVVGFELCYLVEHFTRFTEEVFSVLISLLFVYECLYFLWKVKIISCATNFFLVLFDFFLLGSFNFRFRGDKFSRSSIHFTQHY